MWKPLAKFVLKYRLVLILLVLSLTAWMGYFAKKAELSYEFSRALPKSDAIYKANESFKKMFGDDGNLLVVGVQDEHFFKIDKFAAYQKLVKKLKGTPCVEDVLSVSNAVILEKDPDQEKFNSRKIFSESYTNDDSLQNDVMVFKNQPFYNSMLYNSGSNAYLTAVKVNKDSINSPIRVRIAKDISAAIDEYKKTTKQEVYISGLPWIRTVVAERIKSEMRLFLVASLVLSILILFLFFRSISTTLISLGIVLISVVFTLASIYLCGYKITLLTALLPSLVVVIGIPNCIYFINKYHTSYLNSKETDPLLRKNQALVDMVSKMGVVTLFCNITAAIGFAVFALTKSEILKEFGVVSGISIMVIFMVSFLLLPSVLSYLPAPRKSQLKYLENKWIGSFLNKVEYWVFGHKKWILVVTGLVSIVSIMGVFKLKTEAFIVDDLPKTDKVFTDLKFFEKHFKGVMPLEILIDTKKRRGIKGNKALKLFNKVDSFSMFIAERKEMNRPLSISEGLKFATQAFNDNDSTAYHMPGEFESAFLLDYLNVKKDSGSEGNFAKMMNSFVDTSKRYVRLSVSMADIGTEKLPIVLKEIEKKSKEYFDTSYNVSLTGTSITFLEGSKFIIKGLKESIVWAFLLIAVCMLYLFRSLRVLVCSLLPNLIPLLTTAGIMGWAGVPLKPSTVIVFSIALGIAIDITIRFLVNYRQVLPENGNDVKKSVSATVQQTGLSIIYTSLVLTAGFIVFCASSFGGIFALGWLTSVTLFVATITNLLFLPVLLIVFTSAKK
jgi:predicted RND superfamily exporter protein